MNSPQPSSDEFDPVNEAHSFQENLGFGSTYIALMHELDALLISAPPILHVIYAQLTTIQKKLLEFESKGELTINDANYRFSGEFSRTILDLLQQQTKFSHLNVNLPDFFIVYIMGRFESYIVSLIRHVLNHKKDIFEDVKNEISIAEINNFKSIDDLKEKIIEQLIDKAVDGNNFEKFSWFSNFNIEIEKIPYYKEVREAILRRNCIVHNSGKINQRYISEAKNIGIEHTFKVGQKISLTKEYHEQLNTAIYSFCLFIFILCQEKIIKINKQQSTYTIIEASYQLISSKRYEAAISILSNVLTKEYKVTDLEDKATLTINFANATRLAGHKKEAERILNNCGFNWNALDIKYRIAKEIVTENYTRAHELIKKSNPYNKGDYATWPLFCGFRETPEFIVLYKELFGEDFISQELQIGKIFIACGDFEVSNVTPFPQKIKASN